MIPYFYGFAIAKSALLSTLSLRLKRATLPFFALGAFASFASAQVTGKWNVNNSDEWTPSAGGIPWAGDVIPNGINDTANIFFDISTTRTVTLNVPVTLGYLSIYDANGSSAFNIAGTGANTLTFDVTSGNASMVIGNGTANGGSNTISAGIVLNDRLDITLNDTDHRSTLTFSGAITGGTAPGTVALYITNPTSVQTGAGVKWNEVVMTGANTYTGQLLIDSGALRYESSTPAGAFGVGNETIITGSGRVDLNGLNMTSGNNGEIFVLNGLGYNNLGSLVNRTGTAIVNQIRLEGDSGVYSGSSTRLDMRAAGTTEAVLDMGGFALSKLGAGDFVLMNTTITNPGTLNIYEGEVRFEYNAGITGMATLADGLTINLAYNPNAHDGSDPANGTRTSNDLYSGINSVGDTTGNSLLEARIEFYFQNVTHTGVTFNMTRGMIELSGPTTAGTQSFVTTFDVTSTFNFLTSFENNFFSLSSGGATGYNSTTLAYDHPATMVIQGQLVSDANSGFTVRSSRELVLENANANFEGTAFIKGSAGRYLPTGYQTTNGVMETRWAGVRLSGADGGLISASTVELARQGSLWLDNTDANQNNRLNDSGTALMNGGNLLLTTNAAATNTENFGNIQSALATNKLFIDTRAGGAADITLNSLVVADGGTFRINVVDDTDTWGVGAGSDVRVAITDASGLVLSGNATGTIDRAVVRGVFGSISPGAAGATVTRPEDALLNAQARSGINSTLMTTETVGGVTYLRPLLDSEYDTSATGSTNSNWKVIDPLGTVGNKATLPNVATDLTINSLTIADPSTDNVGMDYLYIANGATLTINSGIINFANYNSANASNSEASIRGGTIDMAGQLAIINSGNFRQDLDINDANYYNYLVGNNAYIRSNIVNANGLLKTGRNNLYLDTWNQFIAGSTIYSSDEASLVVRHSNALSGANEVVLSGAGNFLLQGGVNVEGVDIRVTQMDGDRVVLRSEDHHNTFAGDIIFDTVDSAGSKEFQKQRVTALNNATLTLYGDIYTDNNDDATDSDSLDDPYYFSTDGGGSGVLNFRGQVKDTASGSLTLPVGPRGDTATTIDRNHSLRFQVTGNDEMTVNAFQQWDATGTLEVRQGYLRIQYDPSTGNGFLTDNARNMILANDSFTRFQLGTSGTAAGTYHNHVALTQDGQVFNYPYLYVYNDNSNGTATIGGENRSGTVYYGSENNDVNFSMQIANQGGDREVRFLQLRGGTMVWNGRLDDEGTSVNSSISVMGPGTVVYHGNASGISDVERWNFLGGSAVWEDSLGNNRYALSTAITSFGGGSLTLMADATARTQALTGNIYFLSGGSAIEAQNNNALTLGAAAATLTRRAGSTLAFTESGNGAINISATGLTTTAGERFASWATYGTSLNNVTDWAARDGTTGVRAFTGYTNDTFAAGAHTNVTANAALSGATSTATVRFDAAATVDIGGAGSSLTVTEGGILVPSTVSGPVQIENGTLTSGGVAGSNDLILHNYGTGETTIAATITDNGSNKVNLVHSGTGTTVLSAANTYTGDTYLNGGVLYISSDGSLGEMNASVARILYIGVGSGYTTNQSNVALNFITSTAPTTAATGTFNTNGSAQVSAIALTGGGSGYTDGVYVQAVAGSGTNGGIWAIMDSGNLHMDGGTLKITQDVELNGGRTIFLGANGGTFDVSAGSILTINGLISAAASDVSSSNGYTANQIGGDTQRYTDRNPDIGDLIIQGGGTVKLTGTPNNSMTSTPAAYLGTNIGGIIYINEGTLRVSMAGSAANEWFGTNRSFTDSTIIAANGTLELNASSDGDMYEWFTFEGTGYLGGGTVRTIGTARSYDFTGQLFINGDTFFNMKNGSNIYLGESTGGTMYGTGDIIRGGVSGEFRIYTNSPDWTGDLVLGGGTNRIYNDGKILGVTEIQLSRNTYLGIGNGGTTVDNFDSRLNDNVEIYSNGTTRLRMEATGGAYSGIEKAGKITSQTGTLAIEVDIGADIVSAAPRLTDDYAGFRFTEIVRDNMGVVQFRSTDAGTAFADSSFSSGATADITNRMVVQVDVAPNMTGGDGTNGNTSTIAGFFGGVKEAWISDTTDQRMSDPYSARHFMTAEQGIDPKTGDTVFYVRPLSDADGSTDYLKVSGGSTVAAATYGTQLETTTVAADQNLRLTGLAGDSFTNEISGRNDQIITLTTTDACGLDIGGNMTVNTLSFGQSVYGNGVNGSGETLTLYLNPTDTLKITSGMIAFTGLGYQDLQGAALDANRNLDLRSYVQGGTLDMDGQQAILYNQSRWVFYNTSDDINAYRQEDGDNTHARITSNITNTGGNGLLKAGAGSIYLDGANSYTGDTSIVDGTLYVRHNEALGQSTRINVVGDGQFVIGLGARIEGADLYIGQLTSNRFVLSGESDGSYFGGNVIIDNVDAAGIAGGVQRTGIGRIANINSTIFTVGGDIYGGAFDANSTAIGGALATQSRIFSTLSNSGVGGLLDLRGTVRDTATGALSSPVTTANQNDVLRMEVAGNGIGADENTVQLWQQYDAAGRIVLVNSKLRYAGTGNFYTDAAAAAINPANEMTGFQMGARSLVETDEGIDGDNMAFTLVNAGSVFNLSSWEVGVDTTDKDNIYGTGNYGLGNTTGNTMIGGENRAGEVTFGTGTGSITFTQTTNLTAAYNRDLRLYATKGGEVTFSTNLVDGGNLVNSSITKIGSGQVNLRGSTAGASTVERVNVLGGVLSLEGYGTNLNRRVGNGATLYLGGGSLIMDGSEASFTENFSDTTLLRGGSTLTARGNGAGNAGNLVIADSAFTQDAGSALHFQSQAGGVITLSGMANTSRLGSWATYGASTGTDFTATDWAATNSSGQVVAFTGYAADSFASGSHTDVVSAGQAAGTTASVRFNDAAGSIASGNLTLEDGGILFTSNHTGGTAIAAGTGVTTSSSAVALVVHNYATGKVNIAGDITGGQLVQFNGTGVTELTGTNTYTGKTYITGGATVAVDNWARMGNAATSADQLYLNNGTLRYTGSGASTIDTRNITLGGGDGGFDVASGTLIHKGIIASETGNVISTYTTNPSNGGLFITGEGRMQFGDRSATTATQDLAGVSNTYTGITVIGDGVNAITVDVQGQGNDNAQYTPFGTTDGWVDGTIITNNATLEISPKRGDASRDNQIRLREWIQFGEQAGDQVTLVAGTQREIAFDGMVNVVGDLLIRAESGAYADAGGTGAATIYFGLNEGGLYGDGNIIINGEGTVQFRSSMPNFTGTIDLQDGFLSVYSQSDGLGSSTTPIMIGLNGETGQVRLIMLAENGNNNVNLAFDSSATDVLFDRDIIVRNTSQDVRIAAGYYALNGTIEYSGDIQLGDGGPGAIPTVRLYYEDTEGLNPDVYGTQQEIIMLFSGNISGQGNLIVDTNEGGAANDTPYDITTIYELAGDNSGWTGTLAIGADASTTLDTDDFQIVRLSNTLALGANNAVSFRNNSSLQLAGTDITSSVNYTYIGGSNQRATAKIENASDTEATITFSTTNTGASSQRVDVGMQDGVAPTIYGGGQSALNVRKTGTGNTVFGTGWTGLVAGDFSSYTGTTTIEAGTLSAAANYVYSPNSRFILSSGATLRGHNDGTGFLNTIGSLVGVTGSTLSLGNGSGVNMGADNSIDADFAGSITGNGSVGKVGTGTQTLSGVSTFTGEAVVRQGRLVVANNAALGNINNMVYLGNRAGSFEGGVIDARAELLLAGSANNIAQMLTIDGSGSSNVEGISIIGTRELTGAYGFSGYVDVVRDWFAVAGGDSTVTFSGVVSAGFNPTTGPITKIGTGTVAFSGPNSFGAGATQGSAINGGMVVRHGTIAVAANTALSTSVVELGDRVTQLTAANLATTSSLLVDCPEAEFLSTGDGSGGLGTGAFMNVTNIVDGVTLTSANVGMRILVKDELSDPERNGVYEVVSVDAATGRMNLTRVQDFDQTTEMVYGASVAVLSGTQAGDRYFMASANIAIVNGNGTDPVHWEEDVADADVALLVSSANRTVANHIDINDTNGAGASIVGGSFTSGTSTLSGNITLQEQTVVPGFIDNVRELTLTSASNDSAISGETGTIIAGQIGQAANTQLSVRVSGGGTVTMAAANTYTGLTTVAADGRLQVGYAGVDETAWATGTTGSGGTLVLTGGVISGTGMVGGAGSTVATVHTIQGDIRPGDEGGAAVGTLGFTGTVTLVSGSLTTFQTGTGATANYATDTGATAGDFTYGSTAYNAMLAYMIANYDDGVIASGLHDHLEIEGSLIANGGWVAFVNDSNFDFALGDAFNLIDWSVAVGGGMGGSFNSGGAVRGSGQLGDLYLPELNNATLAWDTSLFQSHGIVFVGLVPEPGKAMLLMVAFLWLAGVRRRRWL